MNWGILSTGVIARNFAETARRMGDEVTLYAVASRSRESADAFADQYGIPVRYVIPMWTSSTSARRTARTPRA